MAADGCQTASDSREAAFGGRSADRQRRRKQKHFIEAAKLGRLDQMLFFSAPLTTRAQLSGRTWLIKKHLFLITTFEIRYQEKQ